MTGKKSKLDALGDALGVTDDTREQERPNLGRGLSSVLGNKMVVDDVDIGSELPTEPTSPRKSTTSTLTVTNERPSPVQSSKPRRKAVAAADGPLSNTSASIPVSLIQRLRDAKRKRWDLARLVSDALSAGSGRVTLSEAEAYLDDSSSEPRSIASIRIPLADLDALDALGVDWRMNRSQVVSAMLARQLREVGF